MSVLLRYTAQRKRSSGILRLKKNVYGKVVVFILFSAIFTPHHCFASGGTNASRTTTTKEHIEQIAYYYAPFDTHQSRDEHLTCVLGSHIYMDVKIRDDNETKLNRPGS